MVILCLQVLAEIAFAKKRNEDRKVMAKEKRRAEMVRGRYNVFHDTTISNCTATHESTENDAWSGREGANSSESERRRIHTYTRPIVRCSATCVH